MLTAHFELIEKYLIARSEVVSTSGHTVHKGTPRETFVREFLEEHLPQNLSIGQGEIIDKDSQPGEKRNNIDVVVFRNEYPRLNFGGGVTAFLAESVVATIEVKSVLDKSKLKEATRAAANVKRLTRCFTSPTILQQVVTWLEPIYENAGNPSPDWALGERGGPAIQSYVVAYGSDGDIAKAYSWIKPVYEELNLKHPPWGVHAADRVNYAAPALDGIFVLGKGHILYDNCRVTMTMDREREKDRNCRWRVNDKPYMNLLMLFMILTVAGKVSSPYDLKASPYLERLELSGKLMP